MRYAIYHTPPEGSALAEAASAWLGRDAFTGASLPQPACERIPALELASLTADAARYGFHATLKAPFRLAAGETAAALDAALSDFASAHAAVTGPRLVLRPIDGFLALVPETRDAAVDALAADVVSGFDRFRAPMTESERARRRPEALGDAERSNLDQWGYPYVFESFRFHMTLTARVPTPDRDRVMDAIGRHFGPLIGRLLVLETLALFVEPEPGAPFRIHSTHALGQT